MTTLPRTLPDRPAPPSESITINGVAIAPTRLGVASLAALAGLLAVAVVFNDNSCFMLCFLLAGIGLASIAHTHAAVSDIRFLGVTAPPVFCGQEAVFLFTLRQGRKGRGVVEVAFPDIGYTGSQELSPDRDTVLQVRVPTLWRGPLRPGPARIQTAYPLGIFRASFRPGAAPQCLVYPAPLAGPEAPQTMPGGEQDKPENRAGVEDFRDIHPYRPGDPLPRISWKNSARGQGLFVKRFQGGEQSSLLLDLDALPGGLEYRLSRLCHMALDAHRRQIPFALRLPELYLAPGAGQAHLTAVLAALARHRPLSAGDAP